MLQIKNTLGGGKPEGLYVWKKSEIAWKHYEGDDLTTKFVLAENVDEFKVYKGTSITGNEDKTLTLEGKQAISVSTNYYTLASDTTYKYMVNGSDYFAFANSNGTSPAKVRYDRTTKTVTLEPYNSSYGYRLWGNQMQAGNLIGYVVSDKETAYPDGGEKGGYWYEKVVEGITPEMFGCTKMEASTFTLASRTSVDSYTITHSLGVKPRAIVVLAIDELTVEDDIETFVGVTRLGNAQSGQAHFYHSTGGYYSDSNHIKGFNSINENTAVLSTSYKYFGAGIKYGVLAMA